LLGDAFAGLTNALREAMQETREAMQNTQTSLRRTCDVSVAYERQLAKQQTEQAKAEIEAEKRLARQQVEQVKQQAETEKRVLALQFQLEKAGKERHVLQQQLIADKPLVSAPVYSRQEPAQAAHADTSVTDDLFLPSEMRGRSSVSHPLEAEAMSAIKAKQNTINETQTPTASRVSVSSATTSAWVVDTNVSQYSCVPHFVEPSTVMADRDVFGPMPRPSVPLMVPTQTVVGQAEILRPVAVMHDAMPSVGPGSLMTSRFAGLASSANFGVPGVMPPPLAPPSFSRVG